jgi:hypothetical protein
VEALNWAKYTFYVATGAVEVPVSPLLMLYSGIRQDLMIRLVNRAATAQPVRLRGSSVSLDRNELTLDPGSTRYLHVSVEPQDQGDWKGLSSSK